MIARATKSWLDMAKLMAALLAVTVFSLAVVYPAYADTPAGLQYKTTSDGSSVVVTGYVGSSQALVVPAAIDGKPVISIASGAFQGNSTITSAKVEAAVQELPSYAFEGCANLAEVTFPDSLNAIGARAFANCAALERITMPASISSIGEAAFSKCTTLKTAELGDGLESIGADAFAETGLTQVSIPGTVSQMGARSFSGCASLASVGFREPARLEALPDSAFSGCVALSTVKLPASLKAVGASAFGQCSALSSIQLPSGLTALGKGSFEGCTALAAMALPAGISTLPDSAFSGCSSLGSIAFPVALAKIEANAFNGCSALSQLVLPPSVASMQADAFNGMDGLRSIAVGNADAYMVNALGTVKDPSKLTVIGYENSGAQAEATRAGATFKSFVAAGFCTVSFNANGGSGTMQQVRVPFGMTFALPQCTFEYPSHVFGAWTSGGKQYKVGDGYAASVGTPAVEFAAQWGGACTLTYNANGGSGEMPSVTVAQGDIYYMPECAYQPPAGDYAFANWTYTAIGLPFTKKAGEEVTLPAVPTLFVRAVWRPAYTVTFDAQGGEAKPSALKTNEASKLDALPRAARAGYVLDGWYLDEARTSKLTTDTEITGNTVAYAKWLSVGVMVSFDANGGTLAEADSVRFAAADGTLASLPAPTRAGYKFDGWFMPDGAQVREGDGRVFASDTKLTARWSKPAMEVFAGASRYETAQMAVEASLEEAGSFAGVIIVSGREGRFPDALSAAGLSGILNYPLLVVDGLGLRDQNRAALDKLMDAAPSKSLDIIIVGGTATVTNDVQDELESWGNVSKRIAGVDRYETNAEVYRYGASHGGWSKSYTFLSTGKNFPDALSIAPFLAASKSPIVLLRPDASALTSSNKTAIESAGEVIALGGTAAVSNRLLNEAKVECSGGKSSRLGGDNRYETSAKIVEWELKNGMTLEGAGIATGANFPDALGSGFLLGMGKSVLCLASPKATANNAMVKVLQDAKYSPVKLRVFGGTSAVSAAVRSQIAIALGWKNGAYDIISRKASVYGSASMEASEGDDAGLMFASIE